MTDHRAIRAALRATAGGLLVASTGPADLAATATGYTRTAGSFVDDGFVKGMEVVPTGFASAAPGIITDVNELALGIAGGRAAEAAAPGRSLGVGLPPLRAWEGMPFTPAPDRWHVEEEYLPGPAEVVTSDGYVRSEPMYILKLVSPSGYDADALDAAADALLVLFRPGLDLALASGGTLLVRTKPAPYRGQLMERAGGRTVAPVTIPLWIDTPNTI